MQFTEHTNQSVSYTQGGNSIDVTPNSGIVISNDSNQSTIISPSSVTTTYMYSILRQSTDNNIAIFNGSVLFINGSNNSIQNSEITITGITNVVSSLTLNNMIIGGIYNVIIHNNATGTLTFSSQLGNNIYMISNVVIDPGKYAVITIQSFTIQSNQIYTINVSLLNT
jgi:hypothetical protein